MKKNLAALFSLPSLLLVTLAQAQPNTFPANGFVGIGTLSPQQRLHTEGPTNLNIFVSTSALGPISGSGQIGYTKHLPTASGNRLGYFLTGSRGGAQNNFNVAGMIGYAGGAWNAGVSHPAYLAFETTPSGSTTRAERVRIAPNGNVGIGATNPSFLLDVNGRMRLRDEGGGNTAGIWLNNVGNSALTGFMGVLNSSTMGFYGSGSGWSLLMNTNNGYVGIKNGSPLTELHLRHGVSSGATFGLRIQNEGANNNEWTMYVQNSDGRLELYKNGSFRGSFDETSGTYTPVSDARFKKNVEKSENVLDKVMQLGVKRYQFIKNQTGERKYYGMIAQEVEKLFPDVVFHHNGDDGKDYYTMDYSAMGVLAIKGIQELKPVVDKQQEQIDQLQQELAELKQLVARLKGEVVTYSGAGSLGLATPNPAHSTARISYNLPSANSRAQLVLTDNAGRTVRTVALNASGMVNINTASLSNGVYNYTLVVDGKSVETKKLTITRQ